MEITSTSKAIFDNQSLVNAIQKIDIPTGHTVAVIATADKYGAKVIVASKIGEHWEIDGSVEHNWSGDTNFKAELKASW